MMLSWTREFLIVGLRLHKSNFKIFAPLFVTLSRGNFQLLERLVYSVAQLQFVLLLQHYS